MSLPQALDALLLRNKFGVFCVKREQHEFLGSEGGWQLDPSEAVQVP